MGTCLPLCASAADIDRICTNLLVNARDAVIESITTAPTGDSLRGRIEISVRRAGAPASGVATDAEIVVRHNDTGIDDAVRGRVFEPFFTTKAGGRGHGLGLATTRELVVGLGGSIDVESRLGEGTAFTVRLPMAKETQRSPRETEALA